MSERAGMGAMLPSPAKPPGGKREGAGRTSRVAGEPTVAVGTRLTAAEMARVDAYATDNGITRSEAIRQLIGRSP